MTRQPEPFVCIRCGLSRDEPFTWAHCPSPDSPRAGLRTCGGTVVPKSQVEETRKAEQERFRRTMAAIAQRESGWGPE